MGSACLLQRRMGVEMLGRIGRRGFQFLDAHFQDPKLVVVVLCLRFHDLVELLHLGLKLLDLGGQPVLRVGHRCKFGSMLPQGGLSGEDASPKAGLISGMLFGSVVRPGAIHPASLDDAWGPQSLMWRLPFGRSC